jgi:PAS domain S-box-containing protein
MEGEVESVNYEAMGLKKDGNSNWVEFYGSRAIIGDEPTIIGSMIDITERKIAEDELKSSEQKYKLLFESNPLPLWMIAKDDLSIIAANEAAANLYGYTKDELLNMSVTALRPVEDLELQHEHYRVAASDLIDTGIVRHIKKDGSIILVQITAHDIVFNGRPVRLSLTNDITEKLSAEQDLKSAYERIRNHINSIKDMAWKQSHLIRSPLANLQGLLAMLKEDPKDTELFTHMQNELNRMDTIIIEMAEDASDHD